MTILVGRIGQKKNTLAIFGQERKRDRDYDVKHLTGLQRSVKENTILLLFKIIWLSGEICWFCLVFLFLIY